MQRAAWVGQMLKRIVIVCICVKYVKHFTVSSLCVCVVCVCVCLCVLEGFILF